MRSFGIDYSNVMLGCDQHGNQVAFVSAGGFDDDAAGAGGRQLLQQLLATIGGRGVSAVGVGWQAVQVPGMFGDINACEVRELWFIGRSHASSLWLQGGGSPILRMRARRRGLLPALAAVRV
jgi:hypothetical protein